ncbi:unnamed protein product [Ceutorhynchus assimilis]|uniref:Peptidase M14 domain-containing protein n=1 Tax=Ceutorhynchus assimilis TaxID=467358 RepID=A0A9N9MUT6_9CUCU|nr:unnamed protein product [Ceutorhynchus assimilis]
MKQFYSLLLTLIFLGQSLQAKVSYKNYKVYKINPKDDIALKTFQELEDAATDYSPYQFWQGPIRINQEITLMVAPQMQKHIEDVLSELNVDQRVMIEDLQERIDLENPLARTDAPNPVNWLVYNTYDEINSWLESLAIEFPEFVTILKPGKTHEGRDIVGIKLDFSPTVEKQVVFMESNIHAREWITSAVNTYILDQFLRSQETDVRALAQKYTWYFFPLMNPDGFVYSHTHNRMWRKTRTRYNIFCWGADPNRNWGYQWMNGGASQNPCSDTYAGPRPFSEPSVAIMRDFIANITHNMIAYVDFHSFSQMLLLPFGHTTDPLQNYEEMNEIAGIAMEKLRQVYGTEYVHGNVAETIYIATGSSMDWVKGIYEVPIAVTYELRDRGEYGFDLPADQILSCAKETLVSVVSIFEEYAKRHPGWSKKSVLKRFMGQCASNKAKGNLSVKKILTQKKLKKKKMEKNKPKDSEDNKSHPMEEKKPQKYTKGTAMSFGFKRRPTPMITSTSTVAWESKPDSNGNKDDLPISRPNSTKTPMHKTTPTSSQKHISSITPKPSRFNFSQTNSERTNKVADIKNTPLQLSATPNKTGNKPQLQNPNNLDLNQPCTRNVTIITRTQVTETSRASNDVQTGKFMFQTTRLPQPEPIRVIETKTAKTIANNNRRSARMWRQYEEASAAYEDCNASGGVVENRQDCNRFAFLENSDSFSDACTPPPLPELPSVFDIEKQDNDNKEEINSPYNRSKKSFLNSSPKAFLKNRHREMLDSPQSSSDQEWLYGGEAMADDLSLSSSPKIKSQPEHSKSTKTKSGSIADSLLETVLKPAKSLEMIDSLKSSMNLSLCDEDANFSALVTNNNTVALLDDEILSPVESLLSSSETEEIAKKKNNSSSNSKDVNEKLTPPGSPSNTTSLSLSDDKEDFLIDDEIADQPELLFEEGNNHHDSGSISQRQTSYASDFSPLPSKKQMRGSFDSLSPCDSIGSEDLMCDYDVSQSNDVDIWDRESGSYTSLESTPKNKFRLDDSPFNNKKFFKNLTPKNTNSPSSLKLSYKSSSSEHRSPKRSPFGYQSMTYDSSSESLALTKANHAAMQHDIIGIRTMLLTLKRVLNDSEESFSYTTINNNNNNNNEFKLELADLRRQVIFLQGQLEDKEKTVTHLQRQIGDLAIQNTHSNAPALPIDIQNRCNAATQTERARPVSGGMFSLTTTPIDDNNPILR